MQSCNRELDSKRLLDLQQGDVDDGTERDHVLNPEAFCTRTAFTVNCPGAACNLKQNRCVLVVRLLCVSERLVNLYHVAAKSCMESCEVLPVGLMLYLEVIQACSCSRMSPVPCEYSQAMCTMQSVIDVNKAVRRIPAPWQCTKPCCSTSCEQFHVFSAHVAKMSSKLCKVL